VGTSQWPSAEPAPAGPSPFSPFAQTRSPVLWDCLWEIFATRRAGCPHCPVTAMTPPSTANGQETRGVPPSLHPQTLPSRAVPIQLPTLPAETRSSSRWRSPRVPGGEESRDTGERQPLSLRGGRGLAPLFRHAGGPEPGVSQPGGDGEGPRGFLFNATL